MFVNGAGSIVSSKVYLAANARTQATLMNEESQDLQLKPQEREIKESIKSKLVGNAFSDKFCHYIFRIIRF